MNILVCIKQVPASSKVEVIETAHYCLVGDLYEILPKLIEKIKSAKG